MSGLDGGTLSVWPQSEQLAAAVCAHDTPVRDHFASHKESLVVQSPL